MEKKSYFYIGLLCSLLSIIFSIFEVSRLFNYYVLVKQKSFDYFIYELLYEIISPIGAFTILVLALGIYYMYISIKNLETNTLVSLSATFALISSILIIIGSAIVLLICNNGNPYCVFAGAPFWLLGLLSMLIAFILIFAGKVKNVLIKYFIIGAIFGASISSFVKFDYINTFFEFILYIVIIGIIGGIVGMGIGWLKNNKLTLLSWTLIGLIFGSLWGYFLLGKGWYLGIIGGLIIGFIVGSLINFITKLKLKK